MTVSVVYISNHGSYRHGQRYLTGINSKQGLGSEKRGAICQTYGFESRTIRLELTLVISKISVTV